MRFDLHTIDSAPEASRQELEFAQQAFGSIPNLYRGLAANPAALKIYLGFTDQLQKYGSLTPVERQVVYLTVSATNKCTYCVGAHSTLAGMAEMPEDTLAELRNQSELSDAKYNALHKLTLLIMENEGWASESDLADFAAAGYNQSHVIEIVTILAHKTISNYFNHMAQTPLDEMFKDQAWEA